jgi:hypothetical protein
MTSENEMQRVWRTASSDYSNNGYFVWEILEVIGEVYDNEITKFHLTKCRDGSYILIQCYHYWTLEKAGKALHSAGMDGWQVISIVPEPKKEIKIGDYVASKRWKAQGGHW